ncbi:MAG: deoxyribose-phosphate aldolase [Acidobacteriota bacterium]
MDRTKLEPWVRAIAEEILQAVHLPPDTRESAGSTCPWCASECQGRCTGTVSEMVRQGADRISARTSAVAIQPEFASLIDHTLLRADATSQDIAKLCHEALEYRFASACINPAFVPLAAQLLRDSCVKVCAVAGFPLGATYPEVKAFEAECAVLNGAHEVDMVINIGALKSRDLALVERDIRMVVDACHRGQAICKVIIETAYLDDDEKISACSLARAGGADFVKTSTGFGPSGASAQDVALMRRAVGTGMGIKAAGGIRDLKSAREMIQSGATRIGASASVKIVQELSRQTPGSVPDSYTWTGTGNDYY